MDEFDIHGKIIERGKVILDVENSNSNPQKIELFIRNVFEIFTFVSGTKVRSLSVCCTPFPSPPAGPPCTPQGTIADSVALVCFVDLNRCA